MADTTEKEEKEDKEDSKDENAYQDIDKLQELGINATDIKKLKAAGLFTISSIIMNTRKTLTAIKGLSEAKVTKLIETAKKVQDFGFITGTEVLQRRKNILRISTGSSQLDELLRGGIESMGITEAFGEFRTGKTQLALTLCVTAQLPTNMGGGNGKVIYIDTEGTFRPDRIVNIAERFGVEPTAVLDNITYARAHTHEHQMDLLTGAAARMIDEHFALIVVDSATALFRVDFMGRGQLAERQQKLGQFLSKLMKISEEFNVAVFITNQVVSDPGGGAMFMADTKKPIGGHIMAHASTTRLYLRKGKAEQRICKIYDSPCLPGAEAIYQLSEGGVTNATD